MTPTTDEMREAQERNWDVMRWRWAKAQMIAWLEGKEPITRDMVARLLDEAEERPKPLHWQWRRTE